MSAGVDALDGCAGYQPNACSLHSAALPCAGNIKCREVEDQPIENYRRFDVAAWKGEIRLSATNVDESRRRSRPCHDFFHAAIDEVPGVTQQQEDRSLATDRQKKCERRDKHDCGD